MRNLKDWDGQRSSPAGVELYRDRVITSSSEFEGRRGHMESLCARCARRVIDVATLYLAWIHRRERNSRRAAWCRSATAPSPSWGTATCAISRSRAPRRSSPSEGHEATRAEPNVFRRVRARSPSVFLERSAVPPARVRPGPDGSRAIRATYDARYGATSRARRAPTGRRAPRSTGNGLAVTWARRPPQRLELGNENACSSARGWKGWRRGRGERHSPRQELSGFPSLPTAPEGRLAHVRSASLIHPYRLSLEPGLPAERPAAHRHPPALLLRQQPGRDRGRGAHGRGA